MFVMSLYGRDSLSQWLRGAYEARKHYDRMSQASKRGNIYDDALRHGRLWAEKQTSTAKKGGNQAGLF